MRVPKEGLIVSNLGRLMEERHLSVAAVARLVGVTRPTVRRWRDGSAYRLGAGTLAKLCHGLQVSPGALLTHLDREACLAQRRAARRSGK